jgi:hypothetical protein
MENNSQVILKNPEHYPMAARAIREDNTNIHFQQLSLFIVVLFRV